MAKWKQLFRFDSWFCSPDSQGSCQTTPGHHLLRAGFYLLPVAILLTFSGLFFLFSLNEISTKIVYDSSEPQDWPYLMQTSWNIDLRHHAFESIDKLRLELLEMPADISWKVAFANTHEELLNTSQLTYEEITSQSPIKRMARGRKFMQLKMVFKDRTKFQMRSDIRKVPFLFRLAFEMSGAKQQPAFQYRSGDDVCDFPAVLVKVSETLQTFAQNEWMEIVSFPGEASSQDKELIELLARSWESLEVDQLAALSPDLKWRLIQWIDYLGMQKGMQEFFDYCFLPACKSLDERRALLFSAWSQLGDVHPVTDMLCRFLEK